MNELEHIEERDRKVFLDWAMSAIVVALTAEDVRQAVRAAGLDDSRAVMLAAARAAYAELICHPTGGGRHA